MTPGQPSWQVPFDGSGGERSGSRFVEVACLVRMEVTDVPALQAAVQRLDGPPADALYEQLREVPAVLVGRLVEASLLVAGLPGLRLTASSSSAGEYDPGAAAGS